jgi:hypothetical protein
MEPMYWFLAGLFVGVLFVGGYIAMRMEDKVEEMRKEMLFWMERYEQLRDRTS